MTQASETITVPIPKPKRRIGVLPTRREVDKAKKHPRQDKHKKPPEYGETPR